MPYDKGDFTQQGVNGDVSALVRLNEKRVMKVVLSSDDESDNCDISGAVYDLLNGTSYPLGGTEPTGTITITENGEGIDVAQYRLADVNVQGETLLMTVVNFINDDSNAHTISQFCTVALGYAVKYSDYGTNPDLLLDAGSGLITAIGSTTIRANSSLIVKWYYLYDSPTWAAGIAITSDAAADELVNMNYDSQNQAYMVTDSTVDSSITIKYAPK